MGERWSSVRYRNIIQLVRTWVASPIRDKISSINVLMSTIRVCIKIFVNHPVIYKWQVLLQKRERTLQISKAP